MTSPRLDGAIFRKSRRSGQTGNCVEVADNLPDIVAVRDSKDRDGGTLIFDRTTWSDFINAVKDSGFDR